MDRLIQFSGRRVAVYATPHELDALFSDDFMRSHTNFSSFEEFRFSGAVFVDWTADFVTGPTEMFDRCVRGKTVFNTWEDMFRAALAVHGGAARIE